ncbi:class I SAM-dependent methyltransferase [Sphingomonas crocodyli]|uniref:Class I SAM-dependent methyltransferase n=1 Tax=Sphingomonas crocodyli TaxID=1979270 RepID=A0A437M154_9SPHN|nr:SAM-dependent methyltransferase [Sphingomonas crocodyli]RVT91305.1 class I SAM-dependent methyltransferase [Sphingomonas crocodyli]
MESPAELADRLIARIAADGPIPVADYMEAANIIYYGSHDPFGVQGDFITSPEVSQMFGELIGIWIADLWTRAGKPDIAYVELGPGRGTLAADALRAMRSQGLEPPVHFVETSPVLRKLQAERVPNAIWHDDVRTLPDDIALTIVANEFFDALPFRQYVMTYGGWRERMVRWKDDAFGPVPGDEPAEDRVPDHLHGAVAGSIYETSPVGLEIAQRLARRIARQGGALLAIDYGHEDYDAGDTLQALNAHAYADVFANPGANDLTAHVDFTALGKAAQTGGARVHGPVSQAFFLSTLGIAARAAALGRLHPDRMDDIGLAHRRLVNEEEMGTLFRALAMVAPRWPNPAGF